MQKGQGLRPVHAKGNTPMRQSNQQRFQIPKAGQIHQSRGSKKLELQVLHAARLT